MTTGFEGPEKKFELLLAPGSESLRERGHEYWSSIVRAAGAAVLSQISNQKVDAYLLSESSLFVYARRLVMITCGCTTLASALEKLLRETDTSTIQSLIFERKNENFPHAQLSRFEDDLERLAELIPCTAVEFGNPEEDCIKLFHLDKRHNASPDDSTLELLMHDISADAQDGFKDLFDKAIVDDYVFEPQGYSLNAIRDEYYFTIHVTPEENGSYASFETNCKRSDAEALEIFDKVISRCSPKRFDLMMFQYDNESSKRLTSGLLERYNLSCPDSRLLGCGYSTTYIHGDVK